MKRHLAALFIVFSLSTSYLSAQTNYNEYSTKIYSNYSNLMESATILKNAGQWKIRCEMMVNNHQLYISNSLNKLSANLNIANDYMVIGNYQAGYSLAKETDIPITDYRAPTRFMIMLKSAEGMKDDSLVYSSSVELFDSIKTDTVISDKFLAAINTYLNKVFELNVKTYDVKTLLQTANSKLSLRLIDDKTKWEPVIAKIRTYLETL